MNAFDSSVGRDVPAANPDLLTALQAVPATAGNFTLGAGTADLPGLAIIDEDGAPTAFKIARSRHSFTLGYTWFMVLGGFVPSNLLDIYTRDWFLEMGFAGPPNPEIAPFWTEPNFLMNTYQDPVGTGGVVDVASAFKEDSFIDISGALIPRSIVSINKDLGILPRYTAQVITPFPNRSIFGVGAGWRAKFLPTGDTMINALGGSDPSPGIVANVTNYYEIEYEPRMQPSGNFADQWIVTPTFTTALPNMFEGNIRAVGAVGNGATGGNSTIQTSGPTPWTDGVACKYNNELETSDDVISTSRNHVVVVNGNGSMSNIGGTVTTSLQVKVGREFNFAGSLGALQSP
jgi:hypothetical protein